jgi:DNA-directed RNA polymerase subunit RPC12/RpoP
MDIFDQTGETGRAVICPYCGSSSTELFALFGQQLLTVQYYCNACHTPFEHIKDDVDDERAVAHVTDHISFR